MASMHSIVYFEVCEPHALRHCGSRDYSAVKKRKADHRMMVCFSWLKRDKRSKIEVKANKRSTFVHYSCTITASPKRIYR